MITTLTTGLWAAPTGMPQAGSTDLGDNGRTGGTTAAQPTVPQTAPPPGIVIQHTTIS